MSNLGSLRQVRRRIRSVENTKKITRAMEMVAAAKLKRFQDLLESARPYTEKMEELLQVLGDGPDRDAAAPSPYLRPVPSGNVPVLLVLFTSDTGLCGTYNGEVEDLAHNFLEEHRDREVKFVFVGKHGANAFRSPVTLASFSDLRVSRVEEILEGLRKTLETAFLEGKAGEVKAVYTRTESLSRYHPKIESILPINGRGGVSPPAGAANLGRQAGRGDRAPTTEYTLAQWILEPDRETVLNKLLPAVFEARLRFIFYHALLTEQIARMTAMRQATQNAEEMIDELTLLRNKARQAAITKEIIEVVSGSRALKLK